MGGLPEVARWPAGGTGGPSVGRAMGRAAATRLDEEETVRYREESAAVDVMVEGALPADTVAAIVEDARRAPGRRVGSAPVRAATRRRPVCHDGRPARDRWHTNPTAPRRRTRPTGWCCASP